MTPHYLAGYLPGLLLTRSHGHVNWMTRESLWAMPENWPKGLVTLDGLRPMLVGSVFLQNRQEGLAWELGRFGLQ